jgi:hypothetical protein
VKKMIGAMLVGVLMLACSESGSEASPSPSVVTVTASPTMSPTVEPEKPVLATARGPFNGTCVLVKSVGPVDSIPRQQANWKFRPQGDQKLQLFSKSGGYTMKLDRTSPTKFYGTVRTANDWQFAYAVKIVRADPEGFAQAIEVVTHDTAPGGIARESFLCHLRPGGTGGTGD